MPNEEARPQVGDILSIGLRLHHRRLLLRRRLSLTHRRSQHVSSAPKKKLLSVTARRPPSKLPSSSARSAAALGDISSAVQELSARPGLRRRSGVRRHGIGRAMHEDPQVPNFGPPAKAPVSRPVWSSPSSR